jgi:Ca-activated chloride channel family protein
VTWTGPNGQGDYVTIVALGALKWTNESYFYTSAGSPGPLVAPIATGDYELWYVTGTDAKTMVRAPITDQRDGRGPGLVATGDLPVTWTGLTTWRLRHHRPAGRPGLTSATPTPTPGAPRR